MINRSTPRLAAATAAALCSGGCTSLAVSNNDPESRTSFALGLERGHFKNADRTGKGLRTDCTVTTKAGAMYRCHVGGGFTAVGAVVGDAVCSQSGRGSVAAPCNPLLKAAGKC
ncbi:MAG: hypothetical protein JNJ55_06570 [Betaproteobacteria bacterium]|nr:hypothetical protein [Betaproteobacteria bacterium]